MKFILKLFPEIMVKGTSVKKKMVMQLQHNLINLLRRVDPDVRIKYFTSKLEIFSNDVCAEAVRHILISTPGIEQVLEAVQFEVKTLDEIVQKVALLKHADIQGKTFLVRCRRVGEHEFTSYDLERKVGEYLFNLGGHNGVSLKNPDVIVRFELEEHYLNIVIQKYLGIGGFPLGTQGEVLSLMSGGFDSTVASYLTMKRGIKTHFVFFNLGGLAHELGVKQVALHLWSRFGASHRVQFVSVPFEGVVAELFKTTHESYMGVTLKFLMLKAAEAIASQMDIDVLVTGESVGQVSSQTLRNLAVLDGASQKLILRPLIVMDKSDIMATAEQIGTRQFAEAMPEYCGVISQNPTVNASFKRMAVEAEKFDSRVLQAALDEAVALPIDKIVEQINQSALLDVVLELTDQVVIDIRAPLEVQKKPLDGLATLQIPFYELIKAFETLGRDQRYVLYCEKGVMSQLHAEYLKNAGYDNVKVYRPRRV